MVVGDRGAVRRGASPGIGVAGDRGCASVPGPERRRLGRPHRLAQQVLIALFRRRRAGFAVYDLENDVGTPIYVHAKMFVVDDVWVAVGSDNLNLRSWTHDSELSIGALDSARSA